MHPQIAIIGGGPAGLVLAISLARRKIPSVVFESLDNPIKLQKFNPSRSYAIDITGHGLKAIRHIDAVEEFDRALITFDGLKLNGRVVDAWDEPGWIASRGDIVSVLTTLALEEYAQWIDIHFRTNLNSIEVHQGLCEVNIDGEERSKQFGPFDLVVAADGGGSKVRQQAAQQDTSYTLSVENTRYFFKMLAMDQNTSTLDKNYLQVISNSMLMVAGAINGPGGKEDPLWFCAVPYLEDKRYPSMEAVKKELQKKCPKVLQYCSDDALEAFADLPAQNIGRITLSSQLHAGKVVFLGDAAVSYPPIGQGINGAMESAMVLDQCLTEASSKGTMDADAINNAMLEYSERWLPETRAVSWFGKKLNQAKRWHVIRALMLEALRLGSLHHTKSSTMSYAEAQRRAKRLGPIWLN